MIPQLDLAADIVPAQGLGGFTVGSPLLEYEATLRTDLTAITPRAFGLWQVIFPLPQLYIPTDEEWHAHFDSMDDWRRRRRAGEEVDLGSVDALRPPERAPVIELLVDVRDGIVDAVRALPGYEGGFRRIFVGMTLAEMKTVEPGLVVGSFLDESRVEGVEGLGFDFDYPDPADDEARNEMILDAIVVFDPSRSDNGVKPH